MEITQSEQQKEKQSNKKWRPFILDTIKCINICITGVLEEEKIIENVLGKIMNVNFPNLKKEREKGNTEGPKQGKSKR